MVDTSPTRTPPLRRALAGGGLLFAAVMGVNLLNYLYALVLGRAFGPAQYGAYAAFMSLLLLVSLLPQTLQQVHARFAAAGAKVQGSIDRMALASGAVAGLLLGLVAWPLGNLTGLEPGWLLALAVALPGYTLLGTWRGHVQGLRNFPKLSANLVFEVVIKIAMTPFGLWLAPGAAGAVIATVMSLPLSLTTLGRRLGSEQAPRRQRRELRRFARPIFANLASQAVLVNADVLLVAALLPAQEAGLFAAVALFGRVVFYGSWAVSGATFPMVSARQAAGRSHGDLLRLALAAVAAITIAVTLGCALFPQLVVRLLFGDAYLAATGLVAPYAFMTGLYALANVVSSHYLALGSRRAGYLPLVAAIVQVAAILVVHDSSMSVIVVQTWLKGGLLALLLIGAHLGWFEKGNSHVL